MNLPLVSSSLLDQACSSVHYRLRRELLIEPDRTRPGAAALYSGYEPIVGGSEAFTTSRVSSQLETPGVDSEWQRWNHVPGVRWVAGRTLFLRMTYNYTGCT